MKIDTVLNHFAHVDPILFGAIQTRNIQLKPLTSKTDSSTYFAQLCGEIISQQLAGKAAEAISKRFADLFPNHQPTPDLVLQQSEQALRDIGLSWAKARYVRSLAEVTQQQKIKYDQFSLLSDEEIIGELTQVKGIGRWTSEMFLIFTLGRPDVFSFGDLGLKNGFKKLYGIEDPKILQQQMELISPTWSPYRSYASLVLWEYLDNRGK